MLDGVTIAESKTQKDELILEGNDVENVSQSGISATKADEPATDRLSQPHRSRVAAKCGTRTFVNSLMVSMFQTGRWWSRTEEVLKLHGLGTILKSHVKYAVISNSFV